MRRSALSTSCLSTSAATMSARRVKSVQTLSDMPCSFVTSHLHSSIGVTGELGIGVSIVEYDACSTLPSLCPGLSIS